VTTADEFTSIIEGNQFVLVDYFTTWCTPCHLATPIVVDKSSIYPEVKFIKVDAEELEGIATIHRVDAYPTFQFLENGKEKNRLTGINGLSDRLEDHLMQLINLQ